MTLLRRHVMTRVLFSLFLVAHGLVHVAIWTAPRSTDVPFSVDRSWLLGDVRRLATVLAVVAGATFVLAGGAYLAGWGWWGAVGLVAAGVSVLLMLLTFTPWWLTGLAIDVVMGVVAWRALT